MNRKFCCLHLTPCDFTSFSVNQLVSLGPDLRISFQFVRKPHMLNRTLHQMLTDWSSYLTGKILSKCVRSQRCCSFTSFHRSCTVWPDIIWAQTHTLVQTSKRARVKTERMKLTFRGRHEMPAAVSLTYFTSPSCCPVCMSCTHTLIWRVKHNERKSI